MTVGLSLFAIAVGAILKFAVTTHTTGIDLATVGVILMVVGAIGPCLEQPRVAVAHPCGHHQCR